MVIENLSTITMDETKTTKPLSCDHMSGNYGDWNLTSITMDETKTTKPLSCDHMSGNYIQQSMS